MYLSAIHGKIDEQTVDYIEKEKQYIQSVENQIESVSYTHLLARIHEALDAE